MDSFLGLFILLDRDRNSDIPYTTIMGHAFNRMNLDIETINTSHKRLLCDIYKHTHTHSYTQFTMELRRHIHEMKTDESCKYE